MGVLSLARGTYPSFGGVSTLAREVPYLARDGAPSEMGYMGDGDMGHMVNVVMCLIMIMSDHLPLKKFLEKNTMNAKVNNWAVELESQNINFEFIAGTKNVLADT